MAEHNELGKLGEEAACKFLKRKNYEILHQNWKYQKYEIDLIARHEDWIIFVEVKTRSSEQWENPAEAVTKAKIKRIVEAADFYLKENEIELDARFDIVGIIWEGKRFTLDHIEDAFLAPAN